MSVNLQPFLSTGGFITAGAITTASYASPAPSINGFSSISGLALTTVSGNINSGVTTVVDDGINSISLAPGAQMDVFGFPFSAAGVRGQLTISGIDSTIQANGTWYYESTSDIAYQLYTDVTYSTLVDATGWTAYTGGGSVAITQHSTASNVVIDSNGYSSKFDRTGNVTFPGELSVVGGVINLTGEGVIRSNYDTVSIQSYDVANAIAYGLRVGDNGGLYLEQGTTPAWLNIVPNAGNAEIYASTATGGAAGHSISIAAGSADQTDYYDTPGGNVNITGGLGAGNDGGGGGPGGAVNLTSGASSDPAGRYGNITINTGGANTWTFDYTGNLTAPGVITGLYELIGPAASANFTRFPNAQVVISSVSTGIQQNEPGNSGLIAEATANPADTGNRGVGVYGVGYTSGAASADGIDGEGHVSDTNDTGTATGVRSYAHDAHAGGTNIGLYASALNGATNYALYMKHGNIFSFESQNWTLVDNTVSALSFDTTGKTGVLELVTTNSAEGVKMSGYANVVGNITGGNIITAGNVAGNTAGYAIGYRDIPQVSFTGNATIATTDAGKHYYSTQSTSYTLTIANNASQGFQVGSAITIVNQGTGNITVAQGSGVTLYIAGNATSGNRIVSTFGMATLIKVATNTWFISGAGVA
jgi:hypothetical protein